MKNYNLKIKGQNYNVDIDEQQSSASSVRVVVNGEAYDVDVVSTEIHANQPASQQTAPASKSAPRPASPAQSVPAGAARIKSPLPGTVLSVKVGVGQNVAEGQTIAVIEAMKMENNITAERGGIVKEVLVSQGATVMEGDTLIVLG